MNDEDLIAYCLAHSRTPVGAISGEMFARLHELAGTPVDEYSFIAMRDWWRPEPDWVDHLSAKARERMAAA